MYDNCNKFENFLPNFMLCRMRHFLEMLVNVIIFHVKEIMVISVGALAAEIVVAMEHVPVLMDGVVQLVIVHQIRVIACQVL